MKLVQSAALPLCLLIAACGEKHADEPAEPTIAQEPAPGVSPGASISPPAYIGEWAVDAALCSIAPGTADPSPIAITGAEFMSYGQRCRVGESLEGTEGGWRLQLYCDRDGVETMEALDIDIDGEALRIVREGGAQTTYVRCEESE